MQLKTNRLETFFNGFRLAKTAEGCSPNTLHDYNASFAHFARWCETNEKPDPDKVTHSNLKAFLAELRTVPGGRKKPLSPKTIFNAYVALRSFYRWLSDETGIENPMIGISAPKAPEAVIEPLTKDQIESILKACNGTKTAKTVRRASFAMKRDTALRDRAVVLVLLDSGLRANELCSLTVKDVDLNTGQMLVRKGKGGKGRIVYIGKLTRRTLWKYLSDRQTKPGDPLFLTREERPLTPDRLCKLFANMGEKAEVSGLHPHQLRHTFATQFLRNGGNLLSLQRLLGHSSLEMVRRYASIAEVDLAKAHEVGGPADGWRL